MAELENRKVAIVGVGLLGGALVSHTGQSPKVLMALAPVQPVREAGVRALFAEAVDKARVSIDCLQAQLGC